MVASRRNNTNPARIPAPGLRFLALVFISIMLMYLDQRENHLDGIRRGIGVAVYPLRLVVDAPALAGRLGVEPPEGGDPGSLLEAVLPAERFGFWTADRF